MSIAFIRRRCALRVPFRVEQNGIPLEFHGTVEGSENYSLRRGIFLFVQTIAIFTNLPLTLIHDEQMFRTTNQSRQRIRDQDRNYLVVREKRIENEMKRINKRFENITN